jgi:mono/diheme cytochrome c family protein
MRRLSVLMISVLATSLVVTGCGGGKSDQPPAAGAPQSGAGDGGLTPFEQENGIGPIKQAIELGPIDHEKAEEGKKLFEAKCVLCHKMTERYVGPALGEVTQRRTAAYIMNMVLNPEEMYTKHPVARQLLAEHMTQMPNLSLTQDQARELVEYLRTQTPTKSGS